jgi:hypothetical protein
MNYIFMKLLIGERRKNIGQKFFQFRLIKSEFTLKSIKLILKEKILVKIIMG